MVNQDEKKNSPIRVLAVDDDPTVLEMARATAKNADAVELHCAESAGEALSTLSENHFDLVFLDLGLKDRSGVSLLSAVIEAGEKALVVVVTSDERPVTIVESIKRGAFDYVTKPISPARLLTILTHVRAILDLKKEIRSLEGESEGKPRHPAFARIITNSPLMYGLFHSVERVARSPLAVLVTGESGVGKELVARAIHDASGRPGAFVPVNVAGLDDTLFADTLFGHVRGAYTGAEGKRPGLVREADNGTLFLDEIGDLGPEAQVKLLRFLQDGEFYPLGADRPERSSARLVLATNADLLSRVREGTFRTDLYYRLTMHYLVVPPLRERREDIPLLVESFAKDAAASLGRPVPQRFDGFLAAIENWNFPGNVRELFSLVHGAMVWAEGGTLPATYALNHIRAETEGAAAPGIVPACREDEFSDSSGRFLTLEDVTDRHIREALKRSGGNQSRAAQLLGISQSTISRRIAGEPMQNA